MWTWLFWKAALERAAKSAVQAMLAMFTGDVVGLVDAPWLVALNFAAMMAVLSLMTSIASGYVPGDPWTSPSLVRTAPKWASGAHRRPGQVQTPVQVSRLGQIRLRRGREEPLRRDPGARGAGTEPATDGTEDTRA